MFIEFIFFLDKSVSYAEVNTTSMKNDNVSWLANLAKC